MTDNMLKLQAFKLKGRLYTLTVLQVLEADTKGFNQQLEALVAKAPRLFEQAPLVLDCTKVPEATVDLAALCQCARGHGLFPIAIQGGSALFRERAAAIGLATLRSSSTRDKQVSEDAPVVEPKVALPNGKTKLLTTPIRSGQQVVSQGDLIVTASVGHGAELLAEGNIHVYGTLRGRVLAGISGNQSARIFCQSFDPELVAIAGVYRLPETMEPCTKPCQVLLKGERIDIDLL
ncbi:MAG: septum site-determining protein MinC [Gammaproteobacteria bacterium]|nr:septum site-determining protein MinC [Gammaproteobacteria bacterium]